MAEEDNVEEPETAAAEPSEAEDPNREGVIAALKRERAGYVARGLDDRVAGVNAELKRLGADGDDHAQSAPQETAVESKPRSTASRGKRAD